MDLNMKKNAVTRVGKVDVLDMEISVRKAEHILVNSAYDHMPVIDNNGHAFGMLSLFDILKFKDDGGNPDLARAWEICSHKLVVCEEHSTHIQIAKMMISKDVHHVIIQNGKEIKGIVSSWDIVRHFLSLEERVEQS